jgi:molybdopterin-guanine dinucleotide biosynthesis protein A
MVAGPLRREEILGVILAGGASRRFGSNKALAELGGRRLVLRVMERARPQVSQLALSGADPGGIAELVIPDMQTGEGPLTGVLSALSWARGHGFHAIATFSCDAPFFPADLVARLADGMGGDCRFASCAGARHPAFALWRVTATAWIEQIYRLGERALRRTQDAIGGEAVEFPLGNGPQGDMFFNVNRPADLAVAEQWLAGRG